MRLLPGLMTPVRFLRLVIRPVVAHFDWPQVAEREALLGAIALQESDLKHRRQRPRRPGGPFGPARSYWQIEPPTAHDCLTRCRPVRELWQSLGFGWDVDGLTQDGLTALMYSDIGACGIAAGILRLHPGLLPPVGKESLAWDYYLASWRPGEPHEATWALAYHDGTALA